MSIVLILHAASAFFVGHVPHAALRQRASLTLIRAQTRGLDGLTLEQQTEFVNCCDAFMLSELVSADAEMWDRVRLEYPALSGLDDETLSTTLSSYINTPPTLSEVIFKTPVGPVVLLNIVLIATGVSVCDLPFVSGDTQACIELAARSTGS